MPESTPATLSNMIEITLSSATFSGNISSDGGSPIIARGVCWNTIDMPTIADNKTSDGTGTGNFKSVLTNLAGNTKYYVRAYATNSAGTSYGTSLSFTTLPESGEIVKDIDGNIYHTVTIGSQVWLLENLKTTKYRNGDSIRNDTDGIHWAEIISGSYCNYLNDTSMLRHMDVYTVGLQLETAAKLPLWDGTLLLIMNGIN